MALLPGLPDLPLAAQSLFSPDALLVGDALQVVLGFALKEWGVYLGPVPIIIADNVISVGFRKNWRLSDYPIENGAFASYNKVETPYQARVTFSQGGSEARRALFLANIDLVAKSLALFNVVTPEKTYFNANVVHYDYERTSKNGQGMITVDIWLEEVRTVAAPSFTQTMEPSGAALLGGGPVQALTTTQDIEAAIAASP